jgi:hypothetical protein
MIDNVSLPPPSYRQKEAARERRKIKIEKAKQRIHKRIQSNYKRIGSVLTQFPHSPHEQSAANSFLSQTHSPSNSSSSPSSISSDSLILSSLDTNQYRSIDNKQNKNISNTDNEFKNQMQIESSSIRSEEIGPPSLDNNKHTIDVRSILSSQEEKPNSQIGLVEVLDKEDLMIEMSLLAGIEEELILEGYYYRQSSKLSFSFNIHSNSQFHIHTYNSIVRIPGIE